MIWARTDTVGPTWTSGTRPSTGREALAPVHTFFPHEKKKSFFLFSEGGRLPPSENKKAGVFFYSEGVRSQIGISGSARKCRPPSENNKARLFLVFVRKKKYGLGQGLPSSPWAGPKASLPVPGLAKSKHFPSMEAATAADLA